MRTKICLVPLCKILLFASSKAKATIAWAGKHFIHPAGARLDKQIGSGRNQIQYGSKHSPLAIASYTRCGQEGFREILSAWLLAPARPPSRSVLGLGACLCPNGFERGHGFVRGRRQGGFSSSKRARTKPDVPGPGNRQGKEVIKRRRYLFDWLYQWGLEKSWV